MDPSVHGSPIVLIVLLLLLLSAVYFISTYNQLQKLSNGTESTHSPIRVAMKKRLDMIEQFVDSVKSYARFERSVLEIISSMRKRVGSANPGDLTRIESESKGIFENLVAVSENYPQLKTSDTVMMTMNAIEGVEDEISHHRYTYNNIVQNFNTMLDSIPSKYVASSIGLRKMDFLNFEENKLKRFGYLTTEGEGPSRPVVGWE